MLRRMLGSLILTAAFCLGLGCEKADPVTNTVCTVENPIESIDWLKNLKTTFEQRMGPAGGQIIQYEYEGDCVFWVDDCFNCLDKLVQVYDYDKNLVCEFGGISGKDTCPGFLEVAKDSTMLFNGVN